VGYDPEGRGERRERAKASLTAATVVAVHDRGVPSERLQARLVDLRVVLMHGRAALSEAMRSMIAHTLESLLQAANSAASHTEPSATSPSP